MRAWVHPEPGWVEHMVHRHGAQLTDSELIIPRSTGTPLVFPYLDRESMALEMLAAGEPTSLIEALLDGPIWFPPAREEGS